MGWIHNLALAIGYVELAGIATLIVLVLGAGLLTGKDRAERQRRREIRELEKMWRKAEKVRQ